MRLLSVIVLIVSATASCDAQVYSPVVLRAGQVDATSLESLANGIYASANARTPREKAEAIWRFFLTDGRFVKPGFWYHIAGWTYEEPMGEVLDPIKLLNSYGFGLCYHIAPLLEAIYKAGGFADARVWFLTGHTVAEVFYDGGYHYFDSDLMGYNPIGSGPLKDRPVASVHQVEQDGGIILSKMGNPREVRKGAVDDPWYPADVPAGAIEDLAKLFTTTSDNWLFAYERTPRGHGMEFALRPGEKLIRYFRPENDTLFYLPRKFDGVTWREFPQEIEQYHIRTANGPRSQKDSRLWATGRIEYRPPMPDSELTRQAQQSAGLAIDMPSPYVVISAEASMQLELPPAADVCLETSNDAGRTWTAGSRITGPFSGAWTAKPSARAKSQHGEADAVTGTYGYSVRISSHSTDSGRPSRISGLSLISRFQLNPRTLPELLPGRNEMLYRSLTEHRIEIPVRADALEWFALKTREVEWSGTGGQGYVINQNGATGELTFAIELPDGGEISGFDAGGRFLDLRDGLAPDKFTAEVRTVMPWPAKNAPSPEAWIAWSTTPEGPYKKLWSFDSKPPWLDGQPIDRTLRWPEVDRHVRDLPDGLKRAYVRYRIHGMAIDDLRLAVVRKVSSESPLRITHVWLEDDKERTATREITETAKPANYAIDISKSAHVINQALILECPAQHR